MAPNRPRGRERNVTGPGKEIKRRGSGLGTGPVGPSGGYQGRPGGARPSGAGTGGGPRNLGGGPQRSGGGMSKIIMILLVLLLGGGGGVGSLLLGGGGSSQTSQTVPQNTQQSTTNTQPQYMDMSSLFGGLGGGNVSSGWDNGSNAGTLNTSVVSGARDKFTNVIGNGQDEVTLMVYLCGTDLESRSKMATSDLQEMIDAAISDKVNVIVYTGGCRQWQNNAISSQTNQIWQVKDQGIVCLEKNLGNAAMTDPNTLVSFIRWCEKNFPANRNSLIFWDHGGGSVSGFGYDEKYASSGSMSLAEIDQALSAAGVKLDFVGFDACLMATAENALMLTKHADYMIASEETEPGIGWYYTNWLTALSKNPSMPTLEIGKMIIDDFVDTCAAKLRGQSTTLSVVDLAEVEATLPEALTNFSVDTCELIKNKEYAQVSNARSGAREFGVSSKIDQVDLVHLAKNMKTEEGDALSKAILNAVKYNRTSSNMTNSYGLSIYFPLRKTSMVDNAVGTYEQIGLDDEYSRCIETFAQVLASGQAVAGGTPTPTPSLMDMLGSGSQSSSYGNMDMMSQLLGSFLGGNVSSISGLNLSNTAFLSDRAMSDEAMLEYFAENSFDGSLLQWSEGADGAILFLPEEQWELVQTLHANMFYDDGTGFIDLGLDNVYDFDEEGNLLAPEECTWLAVNEQPVAYYHESTVDDGENYSISGYIPVLYNGDRAELVVEFTNEDPYGSVVGVRRVYNQGETETVAKTMDTVTAGDIIDFVCDYYSYDGEYLDSYMFGEQLVVDGELEISDVYIDADAANMTYLFTDIYNQKYWTTPVPIN